MSDPKTVEVIVGALRNEATTWDDQADRIAAIGTWCNGSAATLSGLELGIFAPMGSTYDGVRSEIATWCTGGGTNMHDIADRLRINANAYEKTDTDVSQHVEGAY